MRVFLLAHVPIYPLTPCPDEGFNLILKKGIRQDPQGNLSPLDY